MFPLDASPPEIFDYHELSSAYWHNLSENSVEEFLSTVLWLQKQFEVFPAKEYLFDN